MIIFMRISGQGCSGRPGGESLGLSGSNVRRSFVAAVASDQPQPFYCYLRACLRSPNYFPAKQWSAAKTTVTYWPCHLQVKLKLRRSYSTCARSYNWWSEEGPECQSADCSLVHRQPCHYSSINEIARGRNDHGRHKLPTLKATQRSEMTQVVPHGSLNMEFIRSSNDPVSAPIARDLRLPRRDLGFPVDSILFPGLWGWLTHFSWILHKRSWLTILI